MSNTKVNNSYDGYMLMGVTCSGKTALLTELARQLPIAVINADSATIYKELDIGTSKPTTAEQKFAPHYLFDILAPEQSYNVRQYMHDCDQAIALAKSQNLTPIISGGTMFYAKTMQSGISDLPSSNPNIKQLLEQQYRELGAAAMHQRLQTLDADAAAKIPANNRQRLIRALELITVTKKTLEQNYSQSPTINSNYNLKIIMLAVNNRQLLTDKISTRFQAMLNNGLIDEVKALMQKYQNFENTPAAKLVGYAQVIDYINGKYNYATMREKAIIATKQLAKRQLTWINNWQQDKQIIYADDGTKWRDKQTVLADLVLSFEF